MEKSPEIEKPESIDEDAEPVFKPKWSQPGGTFGGGKETAAEIAAKEPYSWQHAAKSKRSSGGDGGWRHSDGDGGRKGEESSRWGKRPDSSRWGDGGGSSPRKTYNSSHTSTRPVIKFDMESLLAARTERSTKPDTIPTVDGITSDVCLPAETATAFDADAWMDAWVAAKERMRSNTRNNNNNRATNDPEWARSKSDSMGDGEGDDAAFGSAGALGGDDVFANMAAASAAMEKEKAAWKTKLTGASTNS